MLIVPHEKTMSLLKSRPIQAACHTLSCSCCCLWPPEVAHNDLIFKQENDSLLLSPPPLFLCLPFLALQSRIDEAAKVDFFAALATVTIESNCGKACKCLLLWRLLIKAPVNRKVAMNSKEGIVHIHTPAFDWYKMRCKSEDMEFSLPRPVDVRPFQLLLKMRLSTSSPWVDRTIWPQALGGFLTHSLQNCEELVASCVVNGLLRKSWPFRSPRSKHMYVCLHQASLDLFSFPLSQKLSCGFKCMAKARQTVECVIKLQATLILFGKWVVWSHQWGCGHVERVV